MSAIAGFWSTSGDAVDGPCRNMLAAQGAYGPTARSSLQLGPMELGRNLFALLPEDEHDRQPLVGGGGRFGLVADVRLDNREELAFALGLAPRDALKMADSEILLGALERWGDEAPKRLLGDFAFAWFDQNERRLILCRDPLGQRPLFWHRQRDFIAFASMPAGLHALGSIKRRPDEAAVVNFLGNRTQAPLQTYFADVQRVAPGHVLIMSPDREQTRRYWSPQRETLRLARLEDYVEAYREELDRAVRARMRTRAPVVASHLSGGWDSGAVTATAARLHAQPVVAFTSVPATRQSAPALLNRFADEGPPAAAVAAMHDNIEHHCVQSDGASPLDRLDEGVHWFERPLFNLSNHGWLSQLRRAAHSRGAQVLLTGEIGNWTISASPRDLLADHLRDEGWRSWWRAARALKRSERPRWRGLLAASFRSGVPPQLWKNLERFSSFPPSPPALQPRIWNALPTEVGAYRGWFTEVRDALFEMDFGQHRKGILGGWGIDKRDPTADVRLVEFCLSLPTEMLLNEAGRRPLARAALADRLPHEVLEAKGKGYQSADWHVGLTRDLPRVEALVEAIGRDSVGSQLIDVERLRALVRDWPTGDWNSPRVITRYRNIFLQALTAGHFLIRASGQKSPL